MISVFTYFIPYLSQYYYAAFVNASVSTITFA
jgi:hypothetical protein